MKITFEELQKILEKHEWPYRYMLINTNHGRAIVFKVGENISRSWLSGDIIAFWENGEHTCIEGLENIEILNENIFNNSLLNKIG